MTDALKEQMARARKYGMRWDLLRAIQLSRPYGTTEQCLNLWLEGLYPGLTGIEARCELDYLRDRGLITLQIMPGDIWFADLTRDGVDVVEGTVPCDPGIARPKHLG